MASRSLGALTVDLVLNLGGFEGGMDKAGREADKAATKLRGLAREGERLAQSLRTPMEKLNDQQRRYNELLKAGAINQQTFNRAVASARKEYDNASRAQGGFLASLGKARGLLAGVGVAVSGITFINQAREAIEFGDEIGKLTTKTGIGAERLSELAFAAKQADVPLESLGTSLRKMQIFLSEAATGSKANVQTLQALGLTIEELRRLAPEDQFELLADRVNSLTDPADKARAAVDLFGRAGADLLPLFEAGAAGIRAAREEAQRLGATLTGEQAAALAAADDAIKRLGQSWDGLARTLTAAVAPGLTAVLEAMTNVLQQEPRVYSFAQAWESVGRAFSQGGTWADAIRELQAIDNVTQRFSTGTRLPPGGRNRAPFVPGFMEDEGKPKGSTGSQSSAAANAAREAARALQEQADGYKAVYESGIAVIEGLRTPLEEQLDTYHEQRIALEQLAATYPNLADQAAEALERLRVSGFEDIKITAEKILPPEEIEKLSEFALQAQRNVQDILANFLEDPFSRGLDGLVEDFGKMLQRMAAQAVAAKIADKIFSGMDDWLSKLGGIFSGGGAGGGGWLESLGSLFGFAGGGYTGSGGKYEPAGIVHRGEGVLSQSDIAAIGGPGGFLSLLSAIRTGYAEGGLVMAGAGSIRSNPYGASAMRAVGATASRSSAPSSIVQNFVIDAPQGSVSRATQQQIGAQAYRGAQRAAMRNA